MADTHIRGPIIRRRIREAVSRGWIVEAAQSDSLDQRMSAVCQAVRKKWGDEPGSFTWSKEVYDDYVIVQKGDALWRVSYTIDADGEVTIGDDLQKVKQTYVNVSEGTVLGPLNDDETRHTLQEGETETPKPSGKKWSVVIIQEGMSKNRNRYGRQVLQEAAPLYEGVPVYMDHEEPAQRRVYGRSTKDKAGFLKNVRPMILGTKEGDGGVLCNVGTLVITKKAVREEMLDAWEEGHEQYGLSHDVRAESVTAMASDGPFYDVTKIDQVDSVDLVTNPAAGGRLMRLVASNIPATTLERDGHMLTKMIEAIKRSGNATLIQRLEGLGATPNEDQVLAIYSEAIRPPAAPPPAPPIAPPAPPADPNAPRMAQITEAEWLGFHQQSRRNFLEAAVAGTALPDAVKRHVKDKVFAKRINEAARLEALPTETEITSYLQEQVELYGQLAEGGIVIPSTRPDIRMGASREDKIRESLDHFFGVKTEKAADGSETYKRVDPKHMSFRGLYVDITGDERVTGQRKEAKRLTESLISTSFDQILGDSITRRMVADYQATVDLNAWRNIADVVSLSDFRTQRRMRFGGYGNLQIVGERAPYPALTSPTDEEATYSPAKRGGTESITIEMIKNDDVGVIRRIPQKLARAALQTLHEFVWDFLATNATVYDGTALAAAGHNNISTTAMSPSQVMALRLLMKKQTDMNNGKRLGLAARFLIVPSDLEELAYQMTNADKALPDSSITTTAEPAAPNFLRTQRLQPIVVDYWTDTNNYWVTASKDQSPMIEIGFLDGREDPEIFVQDNPTVGSLFSNDTITWKIRHIYGGAVLDYRPFAGGIVP